MFPPDKPRGVLYFGGGGVTDQLFISKIIVKQKNHLKKRSIGKFIEIVRNNAQVDSTM